MARKKQEIALQVEIESQEEWEEMLAKEGLTVVDAYMEWAGPCKGMVTNFRRLKNELGDDLLHFSAAKTDSVDALERYRGKCEPCFLFFAGGVLVAQVRGANSPLLLRTITEQLAYEHKVLEGNAERKEIKDPMLADVETERDEEEDEDEEGLHHKGERIIFESLPEFADDDEEMEERKKAVTVAIIKPNVVEEGKVEEVIQQMKEAGIDILESEERQLSDEDARKFYAHKQEEEYFEDLIKYMTSGPCHVLVISKGDTGDGIIEEWRDLLGPASMDEAKEQAPQSLRAKYGSTESYVNALHGSDSEETAMRELAFFFPDYSVPTVQTSKKKPKIQRTLALIRPDALKEHKDAILSKIEEAGFKVAMQKEMQLTKEQAEEFYREHQDQPYFDKLTTTMASGPLLALGLAREEAITNWRDLLGPKEVDKAKEEAPESLRAQFSVEEAAFNQLHGSDSPEAAKAELDFFFPMQQTVAVIKPDGYQTKDDIMQRIREAGFHIAARKETELTKDIAEQFYKDLKEKEYFEDLTQHMTSGPTLFMVLSRENAVDGWRSLIGPTDPQVAKEQAEDSLRAQFGTDIKCNAIHGSSSVDHAKESINLVFGDLQFTAGGAVVRGTAEDDQAEEDSEQQGEEQAQTEQQEKAEIQEEREETAEDEQALTDDGRKSAEDGAKSPTEGAKSPDDGRASAEGGKKSAQGSQTSLKREKTEDGDQKESTEEQDADKTSQAGAVEGEQKDDSQEQTEEKKEEQSEQKEDEKTGDEKPEDDTQKTDETRSDSAQDKTPETKDEGETQQEQTSSPESETAPPADEQTTTEAPPADEQTTTEAPPADEQTTTEEPPADEQTTTEAPPADEQTTTEVKEDDSAEAPDQTLEDQKDDTQTAQAEGEDAEEKKDAAESEEPEVSPDDKKEQEETKDEEQAAATESGKASPAQKDGEESEAKKEDEQKTDD